ncbi:uncharacterized protein LOC121376080 [Gigantopelta aegis]|uniref:uncharacterized protein LOC121376080 n=1 Tax=Gigantopelta aegis TaxID=1735272 RepID=UPI001B88DB51|nr:uncharacterized protein LOC121376080 [Gigantopelta aegis]
MFLLPESRVDDTPLIHKKRREELQRCTSISDDCSASYEQESDNTVADMKYTMANHHQVTKRHSGDERNESTIRKLCRLSRSLSIGHASHTPAPRTGMDTLSPGPRTPMLKSDSNKSKNFLSANFRSKNSQQRKSESALDFKGGNFLFKSSDISLNPLLEKNLQPKHNDVRKKQKSPRHFGRLRDNISKHSTIEEKSESADSQESDVAVRSHSFSLYSSSDGATPRINNEERQSNELLDRNKPRDNSTICDTKNNVKPRDVDSAVAANRSLSKLQSVRALIEHERRMRIKKLQSDLLCIQRELQDLDDLEYEVSQV